jgi:phospholipid/cholesterol/gamma-HCH transport system ATP-binding protein
MNAPVNAANANPAPGEARPVASNEARPVIVARGLSIGYGSFAVQRDLTFAVNRRDVFVVMGPSGCGKSTLLRVLVGLLPPSAGQVFYGDMDFWNSSEAERFRRLERVGLLFQSGALWSSMTLAENVAMPLERHTGLTPAEIRDQAAFKLSLVGLAGFEDFYPSEISGGMRKRAGLARALALDPEIVFFDEPSAGLDPISAALLDELILELKENLGMTVVVVTHELESIFAIGNNSIFLDNATKTILARGDPKILRRDSHPEVRRFLNRGKTPESQQGGAPS